MNARDVLMRAVQCDKSGRILEAQIHYHDGIQILMDLVAGENDPARKKAYCDRIKEYIDRAEQIKARIQNHITHGEIVVSKPIEEDSSGHSYESLFGKFFNDDVKEVLIEEPYLREKYQFHNLITFLELVVKNCSEIKFIRLITKADPENRENQKNVLQQIKSDLNKRNIIFNVIFQDNLHDRRIVLSNGYIIKIGRGLHFYKATNPLYSLGLCDLDFRKCMKTSVDIFRTKASTA